MIEFLRFDDADFEVALERIVARGEEPPAGVEETVAEIVARVRQEGDRALFDYTARFDGLDLSTATVEVSAKELEAALDEIDDESRACLQLAST